MDLQLTDKVIVITGASSGIGRATALTVAAEGAIPILVARGADKLEKAKAEIEGAGGAADVYAADVTDPAAPDRVIAAVLEHHGRIDALVNNAGAVHVRTSFLDTTDEQWLATFDLDFHAARRMSRAAVPAMLASGGGSLVHVSSDSGRRPEIANVDYAAAKLPLLALSKSLAIEFSPQAIRSNVVVSGPTRTELYDRPGGFAEQAAKIWGIDKESAINRMAELLLTRRLGQAEDVARVIAYLVSPHGAPSHRRRMERRWWHTAPGLIPPPATSRRFSPVRPRTAPRPGCHEQPATDAPSAGCGKKPNA